MGGRTPAGTGKSGRTLARSWVESLLHPLGVTQPTMNPPLPPSAVDGGSLGPGPFSTMPVSARDEAPHRKGGRRGEKSATARREASIRRWIATTAQQPPPPANARHTTAIPGGRGRRPRSSMHAIMIRGMEGHRPPRRNNSPGMNGNCCVASWCDRWRVLGVPGISHARR